jgi:hypothetical protein
MRYAIKTTVEFIVETIVELDDPELIDEEIDDLEGDIEFAIGGLEVEGSEVISHNIFSEYKIKN